MSITKADKIFVDTNEEINFIVEKILASEGERVIVVVPQNALIVSSLVSMKILAKQTMKSKHLVVLVTEDEFGLRLAEQAGIVATPKVSDISPDIWEQAQILKERYRLKVDGVKRRLLTERGILPNAAEIEEQSLDEASTEDEEPVEMVNDAVPIEEVIEEGNPDEVVEEIGDDFDSTEGELEDGEEETDEELNSPDVVIPIQRKRREPKMVNISGFQLLAGGDIEEYSPEEENGMIRSSENNDMSSEEQSKNRVPLRPVNGGYTSRDWSKYTASGEEKGFKLALPNFLSRFKPGNSERLTPSERKQRGMKRRRMLIIVAAILGISVLLFGYVFAFQLSSVEIRLSVKTADIPVEQQIQADVAVVEVNLDDLVIPAQIIKEEGMSISSSGTASGDGKRGEKSTGLIEIWNNTTQEVKLKAGVKLENISSGLIYILKQDTTVPAAEVDPDNPDLIKNPGGVGQEVRIEAEKFGEEYNLTESGTGVDFKVGTYPSTDVIGKRFRSVTGGTSENFVAVSQKDFDVIYKSLLKRLTTQGLEIIPNNVPDGFVFLPGSEKFKETKKSSIPAIGEEADSFSVSVEGEVTALVVAEVDLEAAVAQIIANSQELGEESDFEVGNLEEIVITEVVRTDDKATFKITTQGSLRSKVTPEEVREGVAGKSLDEAADFLTSLDEVQGFKIQFTPEFIPESFRRIPGDHSRIKIVF